MSAVNLKAERLRRGKSVAQMAQEIGVAEHVLRYAERAENRPHPGNALKIAEFYGFDVLEQWPIPDEKEAA